MEKKSFSLILYIYKGEGRLLIIPIIEHMYGYSIVSDKFYRLDEETNAGKIGNIINEAFDYVINCPLSTLTPKEIEDNAAWKKNTKYKSEVSFWNNNHFAKIKMESDGSYDIFSKPKSEKTKGTYKGIIKKIGLPDNSSPDEIGMAILDVLKASEEYYANYKAPKQIVSKEIELMDQTKLSIKVPSQSEWTDCGDSGSAEIYQCYRYITKNDAEVSTLSLGIAPELDCCLEEQCIRDAWIEMYESFEYFEIKNIDAGIFTLRAEAKNKEVHKVSYFMQMEEDLLLESSIEIFQPNRRKKLDEKLLKEFEVFSANCKFVQ